ncbi:M48 family metallopeptidase [Gilvimarinus agarilyticus]|uniref:M48 family metallopeptidase n=1 Tax=Gilvimarinus sp. 2_MG-2023 TaxID=3062666 RepID=UPI001C0942E1|nr:M48 family metallopeptidase [Gilvimarinus sp. 2_MG-2023]MBU2884254.1 M48 family metallopeptidase [Gilvimarinus agarilyticus]MDO6569393.1 M48 family metallopeptidase [Gilvimarinus sp. 2_MG-2023]
MAPRSFPLMAYHNRLPPEHINAQSGPWLADLLRRLAMVVGVFAVLFWLLLLLLTELTRLTPFAWERTLTEQWQISSGTDSPAYLQTLTEQIAQAGGLDPDITFTLHRNNSEAINAYATLGGHIVIFDGLLCKMNSEQALAFVLAHELAHLHLRHPIRSAAQQLGLSLSVALLFGQSNAGQLAGLSGSLALLSYSREFEREADAWAYQALLRHYGHINGSGDLFEMISEQDAQTLSWLTTHPHSDHRQQRRLKLAEQHNWPTAGQLTPLKVGLLCNRD